MSPSSVIAKLSAKSLMLAKPYRHPFSHPDWLFELKYDGYRALALKEGDRVRVLSRLGNELGPKFPEVVDVLRALPGNLALDGELTVSDSYGRADFKSLASRAKAAAPMTIAAARRRHPATFWCFDILARDGQDLRHEPLTSRKAAVFELLEGMTGPVRPLGHIEGRGQELFAQVRSLHLEGIIAKRAASTYRAGYSDDWRKVKLAGYSRAQSVAPLA